MYALCSFTGYTVLNMQMQVPHALKRFQPAFSGIQYN